MPHVEKTKKLSPYILKTMFVLFISLPGLWKRPLELRLFKTRASNLSHGGTCIAPTNPCLILITYVEDYEQTSRIMFRPVVEQEESDDY